MILCICVDDRMGLMFQGRRLSKDSLLREKLAELSGGALRMSAYSAKQFDFPVYSGADYLSGAGAYDWCFAENTDYLLFSQEISKIVLFKWNRSYPADLYFTFPGEWSLTGTEDFPGKSHERITMEVYER